jgi:hypothetical protein
LTIQIDIPDPPDDAQAVLRRFVVHAAGNLNFNPSLLAKLEVDTNKEPGRMRRDDSAMAPKFEIRINSSVFNSIYLRRALWNRFRDFDGGDQLNIYVVYHELGHCIDELRRTVFTGAEPSPSEQYARENCVRWNEQVLLSEYAASRLAGDYISVEGFNLAVRDFCLEEHLILEDIHNLAAAGQAGLSWKLLIEYSKLSALAHANGWLRATSHLAGNGSSNPFKALHETLSDLWALYPKWQDLSIGFRDIWLELCHRMNATNV